MFLTRTAVNRPITTLMAGLIVVIVGWVALTRLSVDLMPDIQFPTISVTAFYRGAAPEEVENLVTRPLEQALSSVKGVERLSSASSEGTSTIRLRMQWGTNLDVAASDMRQAIVKMRESRSLPAEVEEPFIQYYDVTDSPMMYLGITSELDPIALTRLAETQIIPALEKLPGVARVRLRGDVRREIHVDIDRSMLEAMHMGVNEVVTALELGNVNQPAGVYDEGNIRRMIRSQGEFRSLEDIRNTVVRRTGDATIRVRDIADVVDGEEEITELTRLNGKKGILVYLFKQAGANTIDVSDRVQKAVADLNAVMTSTHLTIRVDKSDFIRQSISNVKSSAFYGIGLAVIVLIVFLQSFRSTLVIGVSIPLSVLATFALIYFQGFTLNMVSFGGLALGIGMLVDNSIVVLESIFRKRETGVPMRDAAIEGTNEVAGAIVASTLTTLIVFVPMLFITGITGVLLHQLAWVVSFSLVCSLLASLTLTPVLAAYWVDSSVGSSATQSLLVRGTVGVIHRINGAVTHAMEQLYSGVMGWTMKHPLQTGLGLFAVFCLSVGLVPRIGTEFVPKADEGYLRIDNEMAAGIQLHTLDDQTKQIERVVLEEIPEAVTTATFVGDEIEDSDSWNSSRFRIRLLRRSERKRGIDEIRRDVEKRIGPIPAMKVRVRASNEMMVFRMLSRRGSSGDLEVEVRGHSLETGDELADLIANRMKEIPGVVNVEVDKEDRRPELAAYIDRSKASQLGVSVRDITQTLDSTIRGTHATVFREEGEEYNVLVRLRENDRNRQQDVELVSVATPAGSVIPLRNLVGFQRSDAPVVINRLDQQRVVSIMADVEGRDLGSAVADLQAIIAGIEMPEGFSANVAGDWEEQQRSFLVLKQGLILAIVLMYMVMASQFESLRDPLLILVTLPLGAIGVILTLVFTNTTLNVQSYIGLVMLAGIVVNNAIVMVDYMNQLKRRSPEMPIREVIQEAAVRRFRPIVMTTLTTVLAMLPIAIGWGDGGELQAPMARVVTGGLVSGTLTTLLAIPVVYLAVESRRKWAETVTSSSS